MRLIETATVGAGGAATITFNSIPQNFDDLLVVISARINFAATTVSLGLVLNSAASDTSWRFLSGNGSSAGSGSASGATDFLVGDVPGTSSTANTFGNSSVYIPNYRANQAKSLSADNVAENNATAANHAIVAGLCSKTAAVTSLTIRFYGGGFDLVAGTTATLYGITRGSDGIVTTTP